MPSIIAGHVLDRNRRPVSKVRISLKGKSVAESGNDGFFSVTLAKAESRVALTFTSEGYVSNTRVYHPRAGHGNVVVLWPIAHRVKFDPSRDLDIELGSSRIQVPAQALAGPSGEKLNDLARLRFTWFDVTSPVQRAAAPGDFSGQLLDGSIRRLNSYGIFDLGLHDLKGRPLSLSRGARIDLSIAVPPKLADKAPKQVGFFNFEALTGRWIQIDNFGFVPGTVTYEGSVTILNRPLNLDEPQNTTCVTVQVINWWDSAPMPNMIVVAHGLQGAWDSPQVITDSDGFACLVVQRNASFWVDARGIIGESHYGTPEPPTYTSPDIGSDASDCGNPTMCPLLGTVQVSLIVSSRILSSSHATWV